MGAFATLAPAVLSVAQAGQQIAAGRNEAASRQARIEATRRADIERIQAETAETERKRAEELRIRQAAIRARQGAAGLQSGGPGSASAVLAGLAQRSTLDSSFDTAQSERRQSSINQQASWREASLLRSAEDDTLARLNAWFARR